ncbi:hypothetical protein [Ilumatobacter sp.]|uniref:hypothetical protein n=1 Tax=Ilumatobacter sp. TaxID=1967498 RepID=UPI003B52D795
MSSDRSTSATAGADHDPSGDVTIGVTGRRERWSVSPWGSVTSWSAPDAPALDWFVAADDRWHVPSREPTVRRRRVEGTPVLETRLRIPDGDAVQRIWAVPDAGGGVVVEFENESPMPVAVAVSGPELLTDRPPSDVEVRGIELDPGAVVLPVGHRATVRTGIGFAGARPTLANLPPADAVVRGWAGRARGASHLVLPDEALVEAVVSARCDLLLDGPVEPAHDPIGFLLDVGELVRCGDPADDWLVEVVSPTERVARSVTRRRGAPIPSERGGPVVRDAIAAARLVAARAGDERAVGDIDALWARIGAAAPATPAASAGALASGDPTSLASLRRSASVGRFVRAVERRLASDGRLLVGGMPSAWLGRDLEVHHVPTGFGSSVSYALRWHGERPAVLWEQHGERTVTLSAPDVDPGWTSEESSGEALWAVPPTAARARRSIPLGGGVAPDRSDETGRPGGSSDSGGSFT